MRPFGSIGPLAGWELRRLARRGLAFRVRLTLLYTFFLVFVVSATAWFYPRSVREIFFHSFTLDETAAFIDTFAFAFLETQLVLVAAITPALAASAVAEEKDRATLPLLLTTQLTDREIVFGKATGRITFILAAVISGLPVLMLTLFFGGVDVGFLTAGYALTAGTVMLCAAIGVNAACKAPDFRSALLRAYARTAVLVCAAFIPPLMFVSPFGILVSIHNLLNADEQRILLTCGYLLVQVVIGLLLLSNAARSLRLRDPSTGPSLTSAYPLPPRPADPPLLSRPTPTPPALPPVDQANPVLWKERCMGWRPAWAIPSVSKVLGVLAAGLAVLLLVLGIWVLVQRVEGVFDPARAELLANRINAPDEGGSFLAAASVFAVGRYLLPLALGMSGAIAGERFRRTLDVLLSTPLNRRTILRAKLQAHSERGTVFAALAVAAVGMAFTADGGVRLGATVAVMMLSGIGLVIGFGAYLTVYCSSDVRAFRLLLPVTVLAVGWPAGAWNILRVDVGIPREMLVHGLEFASGVCAGAGLVLWWLAERRLVRGE